MIENVKVAVVYLSWLPYDISNFNSFLKSYIQFDARHPHRLIIAFNGISLVNQQKVSSFSELLKSFKIVDYSCLYYNGGQDIEIYARINQEIEFETILFLNTFSILREAGWLAIYLNHFSPQVGLISASASCQSYYSSVFQKHPYTWEGEKGLAYNFRKYKLFLKALFYWRWLFHPFPNAHVRTNAFMVRREEFLQMKVDLIDTKFRAYLFENGRRSLTNYYLRKGMKVLVIGKNGNAYEPPEWKDSNTFWVNDQENLLVSDNQTELYQLGTESERKSMTKLAWGT